MASTALLSYHKASSFGAEAGRYVLYLQYGCPWAQRVNLVIHLKGLENVISIVALDPTKTPEGFQFTGKLGTAKKDPYYGFSHLRQLYWKAEPSCKAPFSVPMLWDRKKELIVSNDSSSLMRMLEESFDELLPEDRRELGRPGGGLYPASLRSQIDAMNAWVHSDINSAVYDVAAASNQETYNTCIKVLFSALDRVEALLAVPGHGPFLLGETMTETDLRLFTSIIRFDVAYYNTLRCSLKLIRYDYPKLHAWMQRLYWDNSALTNGAFRKTTHFEHIKLLYSAWAPNNLILASSEPSILPLPLEPVVTTSEAVL